MADTLDVLTLAEAKAAVRIASTDSRYDTDLAGVITAVSRMLDRRYGPVVQRTITDEVHDGYRDRIVLRQAPITSVTSITEYSGTTGSALTVTTPGVQPANGYQLARWHTSTAAYSGRILRTAGGYQRTFNGPVVVTYVAGRYSATATVDALWKDAAKVMVKNRWRADQVSTGNYDEFDAPAANFPGFALPNYVKDELESERGIFAE